MAKLKQLSVLIRCDGSVALGYGHAVRCAALAKQFVLLGCHVNVALFNASDTSIKYFFDEDISIFFFDEFFTSEDQWLKNLSLRLCIRLLILDIKTELKVTTVRAIASSGIIVASIDDPSSRRLASNYVFYPPTSDIEALGWKNFRGVKKIGWDWVIVRPEFHVENARAKSFSRKKMVAKEIEILVIAGGTDPNGITPLVVKALLDSDIPFRCTIVLSSESPHFAPLESLLSKSGEGFVLKSFDRQIWKTMANADLAITAFGMTAYELAVMKVPAIYVPLTVADDAVANQMELEGFGINAGVFKLLGRSHLIHKLERLMSMRGFEVNMPIDGLGASRIANFLVGECEKKSNYR